MGCAPRTSLRSLVVNQPIEPPWPSDSATHFWTPRSCSECMMCCAHKEQCQQQPATLATDVASPHLAFERQVALEVQDDGRVLQALDCANARYVINNQPVCGAHVLGAQEVHAEHL